MLLDICDRTGTGILSMIWPFAEFGLTTSLFSIPVISAAGVIAAPNGLNASACVATMATKPLAAPLTVSIQHKA